MKEYVGSRVRVVALVSVVDRDTRLASSLDAGFRYVNHSPTGFEWGYGGSGPAQLAFALLLDQTGNVATAREFYQDFKWRVIAKIQSNCWHLDEEEIEQEIRALQLARNQGVQEGGGAWQSST